MLEQLDQLEFLRRPFQKCLLSLLRLTWVHRLALGHPVMQRTMQHTGPYHGGGRTPIMARQHCPLTHRDLLI